MLYQVVFWGRNDVCAKNMSELDVYNLHHSVLDEAFWKDVKTLAAKSKFSVIQRWATRRPCDQDWLGLSITVYKAAQDKVTREIARCGRLCRYKV